MENTWQGIFYIKFTTFLFYLFMYFILFIYLFYFIYLFIYFYFIFFFFLGGGYFTLRLGHFTIYSDLEYASHIWCFPTIRCTDIPGYYHSNQLDWSLYWDTEVATLPYLQH